MIVAILATVPSAAFAQSVADTAQALASPASDRWAVKWSAQAQPTFTIDSEDVPNAQLRDIEDEGEYAFGFELKHKFTDVIDIAIAPVVTLNPHVFDNQDESSAYAVGVKLQRRYDVTKYLDDLSAPFALQDNIAPFVGYDVGWSWPNDILDRSRSHDQTISAGTTYTDVRRYLCKENESLGRGHGCTGEDGLTFAYTASYSSVTSSLDENEYEGPKLGIAITVPAFATSSMSIAGSAERRLYQNLLSDDGLQGAEAERYSLSISFDVSDFAHRWRPLRGIDVAIGARWIGVYANRAGLERNDFAIIPTFTKKWGWPGR